MYSVRLNDVTIEVRKQDILILNIFNDVSEEEVSYIKSYLIKEGFVSTKKEINVFIKSKSFISKGRKEEDKKEN